MDWSFLDARPIIVAITGSNGAGKTTFYESHLRPAALPFVNADLVARELGLGAYDAAGVAAALRRAFVERGESFIFETVFSDPVGEKVAFLADAAAAGYTVALIFIGICDPAVSQARVAMRVAAGGHDVPDEKLRERFSRTLVNLRSAMATLPHVVIYDNDDLGRPYRLVAVVENGKVVETAAPFPVWLADLLPRGDRHTG